MTKTKEKQSIIIVISKPFYKVMCDFYKDQKKEFYMTRQQIGQALEYSNPQLAIDKIHLRHTDRLDKFSVTTKLVATDGKVYDTVVYSLKGIMEICRWSRQPKANEFMDFVWGIMETLLNIPPTNTPQSTASSNPLLEQAMMSLQQSQQNLIDCTIEQGYQLSNHEERITQTEDDVAEVRDSFDNYLPAYKMDEIQEGFQEMDNRISVIENTSRIVLCEAEGRRFHGDKDTLSDDEYDAQCASDLPSKEFAKWANEMVHKVSSKLKLGANCGNIWKEAYKGLQLPNGKQISCLSELIDETYVSFRYIFALRLVKTLHAK